MDDETPSALLRVRQRPWIKSLGIGLGVVLLIAAVVAVAIQRDVLDLAWAEVRSPDATHLVILFAAVLANLVLTGILFRLLLSRFGRVGWMEMQAVIGATTLVNFLPLRPGLASRVAYHRVVNGIAVRDSLRAMIEVVIISAAVVGYLAFAVLMATVTGAGFVMLLILPVPLLAAGSVLRRLRVWCLAILVRYLDLLVWSVRYVAAFGLIGLPIRAEAAVSLACVSAIATMVPLVSNGLGLREWAVGILSPALVARELTAGLTAELVNRAAELLVVTTVGLLSMAWLARQRKKSLNADTLSA